jgi:hypothetical protein
MSKESVAKKDKVSEDRQRTGVQEYLDRLSRIELMNRVSHAATRVGMDNAIKTSG